MIGRHRGQVRSRSIGVDVGLEASYKAFLGVGLVVMAVCQVIFLLVDRLLSLASQLLQGAVGGHGLCERPGNRCGVGVGHQPRCGGFRRLLVGVGRSAGCLRI